MDEITPSHRALRLCIALAFASAILSVVLGTIPREIVAPSPPPFRFDGLAWRLMQATTLTTSLLSMLLAALLPQALPVPASGGGARLGAYLATLLIALVAVANIWFAARPALEVAAAHAFRTQVAVQSLGALIGIAGPLALMAALALRLPRRRTRLAALALLALLVVADVAPSAGVSPVPTGGLLLMLLLLLAMHLHRLGLLPPAAPAWIIALTTLWALPWAVARLPAAGAAMMTPEFSQRFPALADALFAPEPAHHLVGPLPALLCLGALASLLFGQPRPEHRLVATLLGLCALLPALAEATGLAPISPSATLEMLRSGGTGFGAALAMASGWIGTTFAPPAMALSAGWLWLRGSRLPL